MSPKPGIHRPYVAATEVIRSLGITRQTLWRWRQAGLVPAGAKYRDHLLVFTDDEVVLIREYAQRVIPVGPPPARGRGDT